MFPWEQKETPVYKWEIISVLVLIAIPVDIIIKFQSFSASDTRRA